MQKQPRRESDLSGPVGDYLRQQGYTVRSEVKDCDLTAIRGEELIVVELKRGITIDLLLQATERQRVADAVYVAVPDTDERHGRQRRRWQGIERLLKRLEIGLILVGNGPTARVEVLFHPIPQPKIRSRPKRRQAILREIAGRSDDYNVGGVAGKALLTAYREQAIRIACHLYLHGPQTPATLRKQGCSPRTQAILHRNVYGWFERQGRGLYALRPDAWETIAQTWSTFVDSVTHQQSLS